MVRWSASWLTFGPINIYIESMVLPILIIRIWQLVLNNREHDGIGLIFITFILLLFHPHAGQLSTFACATAFLLWKMKLNREIKLLCFILTGIFVTVSWIFLVDLTRSLCRGDSFFSCRPRECLV